MSRDLMKTLTYLVIHLAIGFSVAYAFTGSLAIAGGIALIEPCCNAIAYFFHEKAWAKDWSNFSMLKAFAHQHDDTYRA
ncbi:DUF2061 domain-containing protein [Sphingomonas sp. CJ99]